MFRKKAFISDEMALKFETQAAHAIELLSCYGLLAREDHTTQHLLALLLVKSLAFRLRLQWRPGAWPPRSRF